MDVFDYAMKMEEEGEDYYRELAEKCGNSSLKGILNMLADEEVKHYNVLEEMKNNESPQLPETTLLADAKNIFEEISEKDESFDFDISQQELYRRAQELEQESEDFYLRRAEEAENQPLKEMLLKIAEEEKKHYFLLENIIEFISRPETWLENAEFGQLDEY